jgi:3-ketosteroid 9alpha-monooxygenase subunit A
MHRGWYQLAFERELSDGLSPFAIGERSLLCVRAGGRVRVFDGVCPHRGARLADGRLDGDAVVCAFHAYRIALGDGAGGSDTLSVREYATRLAGGMLFVRDPDGLDAGFAGALEQLDATHYLVPGFTRVTRARPELVVENAFDAAHFAPVHAVRRAPHFTVRTNEPDAFAVEGALEVPATPWQTGSTGAGGAIDVPFVARAYSPTLVVTELGGERPYAVLTATVPLENDPEACAVRLSLAFPTGQPRPRPDDVRYMLGAARSGLELDEVVWQHLRPGARAGDFPDDEPVAAFRRFAGGFSNGAERRS